MTTQRATLTTANISMVIFFSALALASGQCAAYGGPAPSPQTATAPTVHTAAISSKSPSSSKSVSGVGAPSGTAARPGPGADADDKDINPFTGQSLSEAQLRRTLEREKLITAIASEKTKQTQSNSELQMAKLRNVAEKSRFTSEVKVLSPITLPEPARRPTNSGLRPPAAQPTPSFATAAAPAPTPTGPVMAPPAQTRHRSEIRFSDEIVELKAASSGASVIASVDAQRPPSADATQPRPITPITVTPATLPPSFPTPLSSMVPAPQLPN